MGCESRVTPGRPHSDSLATSLPIENSPPIIQTMPSGSGVVGRMWLGMVGPKDDSTAGSFAPISLPRVEDEPGEGRYLTKATTPATAVRVTSTHRIVFGREAGGDFCARGFSCLVLLIVRPFIAHSGRSNYR